MFNLLPDSLKEQIKKEYKLRRLVVLLIFLIFLGVSSVIFIFPSWLVSVYKENGVTSELAEVSKSPLVVNVNSISSIIKSTNIKLKVTNTVLEYPKVIPFIDAILAKKTSSIHLSGILYTGISKSGATISVEGISATREALVSFVKRLQSSELFKTVDLPVSNLAKDKDINFSITLVTVS